MLTPPGVTATDFNRALEEFREALGGEWVFVSEADRHTYLDPFAVGDPHEHEPSAAVAPASVEDIQRVLRIANRYRIPLWTISTGKNLAYGGAAPRLKGSVVLDLKRMNRILEINDDLGYALVEPGVNFFEFHKALEQRGGRLWMSGPAHSWGSVIGNALEHGVGYTPYGEHADAICGMEVVLANGDVVRTGMGAVAGSQEWQTWRYGFGPIWDGVFTQSNFGVVTKMGIWLMPEPEGMANVSVNIPREEDLALLVDTLRPLRLNDTINATYTIVNGVRQMFRAGPRDTLYQGRGHLPKEVIARQLRKQGSGWWAVTFNLFDRPDVLDIRLAEIRSAFARIEGSTMEVRRWRRGEPQQRWMRQDVGLGPLGIVDWHGAPGGHTDYAPVMAAVGARVAQVYDMVYERFVEHGIDCYVGMFGLGRRSLVMAADLIYNRADPDMTQRAQKLFRALTADGARIGVGLYRSHITFMDDAAQMLTYNDHAMMRLNSTVKAALDPNGILSPGKQGIWPLKK